MKFSEKLIELRKAKGLSQEELGNIINVSRQAISKWESEQANPEVDKIKEISKVFDVSIDYLLNDEIDNPKKQTINFSKKRIKKIALKIFLIILAIYLLIVIYKFAILLTFSIKANNIADYDSYSISIDSFMNDTLHNESFSIFEEITYENNIEVTESYSEDFNDPTTITYINSKDRKAYSLNYDTEINKYVYDNLEIVNEDDLESLYTHTTIRDVTKEHIPSSLGDIFLSAINPKLKVSFSGDYFYITYKPVKDVRHEISINKYTGILDEINTVSNNTFISTQSFDYIFDDDRFDNSYLIEELFLEDIEYVKSEDLYE